MCGTKARYSQNRFLINFNEVQFGYNAWLAWCKQISFESLFSGRKSLKSIYKYQETRLTFSEQAIIPVP